MEKSSKELTLFGGEKGWNASDWTSSDDRVRGGSSQSYLTPSSSGKEARFHGTLDIKTLGGAGFASQRTMGEDRTWDLSSYSGIHLDLGKTDGFRYTFLIKDELLGLDEGGREMSTVSWEYDFTDSGAEGLYIPWSSLKPTYRGKPKDDAGTVDLKNVKRFSIMSRSFFGDQEGDFSLTIKSIKTVKQSSDDLEGGIVSREQNGKEAWSWKNSNLMGLGVILSTTWAICFGFCWWKGIDTSHMTLSRWWRVTGRKGFGA